MGVPDDVSPTLKLKGSDSTRGGGKHRLLDARVGPTVMLDSNDGHINGHPQFYYLVI